MKTVEPNTHHIIPFLRNNLITILTTLAFVCTNIFIFVYYYKTESIYKYQIEKFEEVATVIDIRQNLYPSILISSKSTNNLAQEVPIRIFNCQLDQNLINKQINITVHKKYRTYNDTFYYYFPSLDKFCNKKVI